MDKNKKQYHYSMSMEMAAWEFCGINGKSHGMASAYTDPVFFKKECLGFLKKIGRRINQIVTNDEVLRDILLTDVSILESQIKKVTKENNEIDIIAYLFRVIAHLLGWAHYKGEIFRIPVFYQTEDQKIRSLQLLSIIKSPFEIAYRKRKIILQLRSEGVSYQQIGLILGITDANVKQLEANTKIDEMHRIYSKK